MSVSFRPIPDPPRILVADDEPEIRDYLQMALRCQGYAVEMALDGEEAIDRLQQGKDRFSLILLDVLMPRKHGLEALREIRQLDRDVPVIMLSCASSAGTVVDAMKSGATDFLPKPISHEDLGSAVGKALAEHTLPRCGPALDQPISQSPPLPFVPVKTLEVLLAKIGDSALPVLIQGETGAGKEVVARRLHAQSTRALKPFLKLNCAALPSELVESELFGYERGAFTGAYQRKPGMFELADGGTILLDEIGDMDFKLQAKLLQVLQDQEFQRVGGKQVVRVNVRIIAATHCDLEEAIKAKTFREDLYYRLNVVSLHVPALRERVDEIIPIAEFLLNKHAQPDVPPRLPLELQRAFVTHSWPGNIRQLENVVRKFLVLRDTEDILRDLRKCKGSGVQPEVPPADVQNTSIPARSHGLVLERVNEAKRDAERQAILDGLKSCRWNRKKAACALGIDYKALLYKMKKLGIEGNR